MDRGLSMETICLVAAEMLMLFFAGVYYSQADVKNMLQRALFKNKEPMQTGKQRNTRLDPSSSATQAGVELQPDGH